MADVRLALAINDYDHVRDLALGRVPVRGIDLVVLTMPVEEVFFRTLRHREFDVAELSFAKYAALRSQGDDSLVAIPVFPSRMFRHSSMYVRRDGPLTSPEELAGRRVGVPEWAQTAAIWTRGLLVHDYGVPLADVEWVQAGVNQPGRREKVDITLPPGVECRPVPDRSLSDLLLAGDLDAVFSAHPPDGYGGPDAPIRRLLPDTREVELAWWKRTGVFPIMHVVVIRGDVMRASPWVAQELLRAFTAAKDASVARVMDLTASHVPIPWGADHAAAARDTFGQDWWPYGVDANRPTIDLFLALAHEQGILQRPLTADELFAPETLDHYLV